MSSGHREGVLDPRLPWADTCALQASTTRRPSSRIEDGRKRKEKCSRNSFLFFVTGSEFLYSWKRVKLKLDLAGTTTLWENQDVTWTGPVECLVLLTTV